MTTKTVNDILETGIRLETRSEEIYRGASQRVTVPGAKALLAELAEEEVRHRRLLEGVRDSGEYDRVGAGPAPADFHVSDYLDEGSLEADAPLQDILLFAIRREQQAIELYSRMSDIYAGTNAVPLLQRLVREEQGHKERLEREYDEFVLHDN